MYQHDLNAFPPCSQILTTCRVDIFIPISQTRNIMLKWLKKLTPSGWVAKLGFISNSVWQHCAPLDTVLMTILHQNVVPFTIKFMGVWTGPLSPRKQLCSQGFHIFSPAEVATCVKRSYPSPNFVFSKRYHSSNSEVTICFLMYSTSLSFQAKIITSVTRWIFSPLVPHFGLIW